MHNKLARKLLRSRSKPGQVLAQLFAGSLTAIMDREFDEAELSWKGKKSCLLLSFDCDFPEDALALPEIARQLRGHSISASFACVGRWVEDYPEAHQAVLDEGHELFNHSYSHPELVNSPQHFVSSRDDFNPRRWHELTLAERDGEIQRCQEVVGDRLGYEMNGFRAPHFGNVSAGDLYAILERLGMDFSSSVLAPHGEKFGIPLWKGRLLEIPVTTCPRHPLTSFDSWHAFYARGGWHRNDFAELLQKRLEGAVRGCALTNIYLDPKDRERLDFERIFAGIASIEECWTPTYSEFCSWYRKAHPPTE